MSAAAVKNAVRLSSALGGWVVDEVVLVEVEPVLLGRVLVVLVHDAPTRAASTIATTALRTAYLLPFQDPLSVGRGPDGRARSPAKTQALTIGVQFPPGSSGAAGTSRRSESRTSGNAVVPCGPSEGLPGHTIRYRLGPLIFLGHSRARRQHRHVAPGPVGYTALGIRSYGPVASGLLKPGRQSEYVGRLARPRGLTRPTGILTPFPDPLRPYEMQRWWPGPHPFTTPNGRRRATRRASPARSQVATTSSTSL